MLRSLSPLSDCFSCSGWQKASCSSCQIAAPIGIISHVCVSHLSRSNHVKTVVVVCSQQAAEKDSCVCVSLFGLSRERTSFAPSLRSLNTIQHWLQLPFVLLYWLLSQRGEYFGLLSPLSVVPRCVPMWDPFL